MAMVAFASGLNAQVAQRAVLAQDIVAIGEELKQAQQEAAQQNAVGGGGAPGGGGMMA